MVLSLVLVLGLVEMVYNLVEVAYSLVEVVVLNLKATTSYGDGPQKV